MNDIHKSKEDFFEKYVASHLRRIMILLIMGIFNYHILKLIGYINRAYGFIDTIFVMYPATERYALKIVYPYWRNRLGWSPRPVMLFKQNGKWGITCAISSTESDILNPNNINNMIFFFERSENLRMMLNAQNLTFSGILPGVFYRLGIKRNQIEQEVTVAAVIDALSKLKKKLNLFENVPVIILGSKGYIGRSLVEQISRFTECHEIDLSNQIMAELPEECRGKRSILINVSKKGALISYLKQMWQELIVLNEVYPEPDEKELKMYRKRSVKVFHVVGVKANAYPPFPKAYRGGIPCCAARQDYNLESVIRRLC